MKTALLLPLVLTLAVPGLAQESTASRKAYVGLQWTNNCYEVLFPSGTVAMHPVSTPKYTLGYWLLPRLAFETSFLSGTDTYSRIATGTTVAGLPLSEASINVKRSTAVPCLFRYTLTRRPNQHLQVDVVGGATLFFTNYSVDIVETTAGTITREAHFYEKAHDVYPTAGASGRYTIFHRLDLVAEIMWSKDPASVSEYWHRGLGNRWGITKAVSLGLNYPFSLSKK